VTCREIANVQHAGHQDAKAFQSIDRSIDVFKGLVRAQPDSGAYHRELGLSLNYLGILYDESRKNTEALAAFEQAVAEGQLAVDHAKDVDHERLCLPTYLDNIAEQYVDLGRVAEGLPIYRRSLKIARDLSAARPNDPAYAPEVLKSL
jgi:tetratricopeptide (TPR) repeat protein